jgi:hypothetical protein
MIEIIRDTSLGRVRDDIIKQARKNKNKDTCGLTARLKLISKNLMPE